MFSIHKPFNILFLHVFRIDKCHSIQSCKFNIFRSLYDNIQVRYNTNSCGGSKKGKEAFAFFTLFTFANIFSIDNRLFYLMLIAIVMKHKESN